MNKVVNILIGLILLLVPIYVWILNLWGLGSAAMLFLKGGVMWIVMLIGLVLVLLGLNDLKE